MSDPFDFTPGSAPRRAARRKPVQRVRYTPPPGAAGFHPQRTAMTIAAGLGAISPFLPWVTAPIIGSVIGVNGRTSMYGWIVLAAYLAAIIGAISGDWRRPVGNGNGMTSIACALGASGVAGWTIYDIHQMLSAQETDGLVGGLAQSVQIGPGLYLAVGAGLLTVALTVILSPAVE